MGFFSRRRKRKNALRTPDNYNAQRMQDDHTASLAMFVAVQPHHTIVDVDEQRAEAEQAAQESEQAPEQPAPVETDTRDAGVFESNTSSYDTQNTSSSYSSSYDSGSSYSSSYDSGSSYSSSDSGSSYSGGDSGGSW